jgi:hypothetical protein
VSVVFASNAPVRRMDLDGAYEERLDMTQAAVDLSELIGGPVLNSHNRSDVNDRWAFVPENMERETRLEPAMSSLGTWHSIGVVLGVCLAAGWPPVLLPVCYPTMQIWAILEGISGYASSRVNQQSQPLSYWSAAEGTLGVPLLNRRRVKSSTGGSNPPSPPAFFDSGTWLHATCVARKCSGARSRGFCPSRCPVAPAV